MTAERRWIYGVIWGCNNWSRKERSFSAPWGEGDVGEGSGEGSGTMNTKYGGALRPAALYSLPQSHSGQWQCGGVISSGLPGTGTVRRVGRGHGLEAKHRVFRRVKWSQGGRTMKNELNRSDKKKITKDHFSFLFFLSVICLPGQGGQLYTSPSM